MERNPSYNPVWNCFKCGVRVFNYNHTQMVRDGKCFRICDTCYKKEEKKMNKLLIEIAKRLVCKAIKVNTEEYNIQVAYKFINNKGVIAVTLFNKDSDNNTFWFYDDIVYTDKKLIDKFRTVLRKIRKREL